MPKSDQRVDRLRFQIVPRTLIFVFNELGQVLLIKGAKARRVWAGKFNAIGGHIEAGEDILESASRELLEETGLADVPLVFCGQVMIEVSQNQGVGLFLFRGEVSSSVEVHASEEGDLTWVAVDQVAALPVVEDLPELLSRVAHYTPGGELVIGKYRYGPSGALEMLFH